MNRLHAAFEEIVSDVPEYGDLDRAIAQVDRERRRRYGVVAALAAAAAVVAVIVGTFALTSDGNREPQPIGPPTTTPTPTPTASTSAPADWEPPEPLRPAASRVVRYAEDNVGNAQEWRDPRDVGPAVIDIVSVAAAADMHGGSSWQFRLAARSPRDPAHRVIAYGVVVDGDGDQRADCQIGIDNDAPGNGDYHVWVTNLRTHETAVREGPPYGFPVEFAHPGERETPAPVMYFGFLQGLSHPAPCDPLGRSSTFYAWSSLTKRGQVVARDHAPDAAWLPIRFGR